MFSRQGARGQRGFSGVDQVGDAPGEVTTDRSRQSACEFRETLEVAGLCKLTYKKIPTDPKKIAQMLGKDITGGQQLPPGVDISQ